MKTKEFLDLVLGGEGYYCIFAAKQGSDKKIQKLYPSIDPLPDVAEGMDQNGFDVYFALSTFTDGESRKAINSKCLKAFFLDIDCGPGKDYPDQASGLQALKAFCREAKLPRPTLVNSGRGIHVYWTLTEAIATDLWAPIAEQLKTACATLKFFPDPAVTSDVARVLRMPGTHNRKDNPPNPVEILSLQPPVDVSVIQAALDAITPMPVVPHMNGALVDATTDALAGNNSSVFRKIAKLTVDGHGCAQILKIVEDQANMSEPLWRAGLSIAKHCIDGDEMIHKISEGYPGYDPEKTVQKAAPIAGPYTCSRFNELSPGICTDCQHLGKIKSPIVLGHQIRRAKNVEQTIIDTPIIDGVRGAPQTYVIPVLPDPYFRGATGGIYRNERDKGGISRDILISRHDIYVLKRTWSLEQGEGLIIRQHMPHDGTRDSVIPLASVLSPDEFRTQMAMIGVTSLKMGPLMQFMADQTDQLQHKSAADDSQIQFGWTNERMEAFVVGAREIMADRVNHNPMAKSTNNPAKAFVGVGTIDGWKKIADFYNRKGMELGQYNMGLGFGSPLAAILPLNCGIFHMYSDTSGEGKTTMMKAAMSIWGNPEKALLQERDTFNSKILRAEVHKNIFLAADELTNMHPKDISDFIYQITEGQQRDRMTGKGNDTRARGEPWKLSVASTGNASLIQKVNTYKAMPIAEAMRVLECDAGKYHYAFTGKSETDELNRLMTNHYGLACIPLVQYIITHRDECADLYFRTQKRIDEASGMGQMHRFWSYQAALVLTGVIIAKKIGLVKYDIANLAMWIIALIKDRMEDADTMKGSIEGTLCNYLAENYNNILRIKSTDDSRTGKTSTMLDHLIIPDATPRSVLVARYEYDVKKLYLLPKPLREWCGALQINYNGLIDGMKNGPMKAEHKKVRLCRGTNMNLPPTDAICIDASFLDEETEDKIALLAAT